MRSPLISPKGAEPGASQGTSPLEWAASPQKSPKHVFVPDLNSSIPWSGSNGSFPDIVGVDDNTVSNDCISLLPSSDTEHIRGPNMPLHQLLSPQDEDGSVGNQKYIIGHSTPPPEDIREPSPSDQSDVAAGPMQDTPIHLSVPYLHITDEEGSDDISNSVDGEHEDCSSLPHSQRSIFLTIQSMASIVHRSVHSVICHPQMVMYMDRIVSNHEKSSEFYLTTSGGNRRDSKCAAGQEIETREDKTNEKYEAVQDHSGDLLDSSLSTVVAVKSKISNVGIYSSSHSVVEDSNPDHLSAVITGTTSYTLGDAIGKALCLFWGISKSATVGLGGGEKNIEAKSRSLGHQASYHVLVVCAALMLIKGYILNSCRKLYKHNSVCKMGLLSRVVCICILLIIESGAVGCCYFYRRLSNGLNTLLRCPSDNSIGVTQQPPTFPFYHLISKETSAKSSYALHRKSIFALACRTAVLCKVALSVMTEARIFSTTTLIGIPYTYHTSQTDEGNAHNNQSLMTRNGGISPSTVIAMRENILREYIITFLRKCDDTHLRAVCDGEDLHSDNMSKQVKVIGSFPKTEQLMSLSTVDLVAVVQSHLWNAVIRPISSFSRFLEEEEEIHKIKKRNRMDTARRCTMCIYSVILGTTSDLFKLLQSNKSNRSSSHYIYKAPSHEQWYCQARSVMDAADDWAAVRSELERFHSFLSDTFLLMETDVPSADTISNNRGETASCMDVKRPHIPPLQELYRHARQLNADLYMLHAYNANLTVSDVLDKDNGSDSTRSCAVEAQRIREDINRSMENLLVTWFRCVELEKQQSGVNSSTRGHPMFAEPSVGDCSHAIDDDIVVHCATTVTQFQHTAQGEHPIPLNPVSERMDDDIGSMMGELPSDFGEMLLKMTKKGKCEKKGGDIFIDDGDSSSSQKKNHRVHDF
eukprot:Tbor_TRINITY_DN5013_c0_g1::TRINITY_DN5013_c0_g1_i1::g.14094::m.14094